MIEPMPPAVPAPMRKFWCASAAGILATIVLTGRDVGPAVADTARPATTGP